MLLLIRTKDDLVKLLNEGISYSWRIDKNRLISLTEVEIYNFNGTSRIIGIYDPNNTKILESGRVAISFKDARIENCDFKWIGQNPIKYKSSNTDEHNLFEDETYVVEQLKQNNGYEIYKNDLTNLMNYEEAVSSCEDLGGGWRLPTIREAINIFGNNKMVLGEFNNENYLTSTFSNNGQLWCYVHSENSDQEYLESIDFVNGKVRAIRTINTDKPDISYLVEIATNIKQLLLEKESENITDEYSEISGAKIDGQYTWYEAIEICKLIGDGWRLPIDSDEVESISEVIEMYGYYWTEETSEMYGKDDDSEATASDIDGIFAGSSLFNKNNTGKIILLREISE